MDFIKYEAPEMEIIEVEVEAGFCNSPNCPHGGGNMENFDGPNVNL